MSATAIRTSLNFDVPGWFLLSLPLESALCSSSVTVFCPIVHRMHPHRAGIHSPLYFYTVLLQLHNLSPFPQGGGLVVRWCWVNFQYRGVLLIWKIVGQGPTVLEVSVGGGCLDIFLSSIFSLFFLSLSVRRPDIV